MNILLAILGISALVIVHEGGHYLAARAFGMRVLRFSIGFGPTIAKFQPKDSPTVFQVGLIPFMAYVQIAGMNPAEENDPADPELYPNKSVFARFMTIFAGPFANYLTASLLVFVLAIMGHHGENPPHTPMLVESVQPGSPAMSAGIQPGDVIVQANGKAVSNVVDLIRATSERAGKATTYAVERHGKPLAPFTITPMDDHGRGVIGIIPKLDLTPMPVGRAVSYAVAYPYELTVQQLEGFRMMYKQGSTEGVVGPVGMVKIVSKTANFVQLTNVLILISVALGMFNLMPLPALDGGRLVFLGYEIITRRRANERIETMVHTVGLVLLLCLIALVTLRDVAG
ncbi:MAG: Intrarane protease RasP/YluC, implicated in cell division based on FtsL cleavage [Myxococcaceae bacterium]|nr:Intrarane protease RasP/YluC, implicated in cell division based on FtsL cleavage [Myxococcaceae bacterium]